MSTAARIIGLLGGTREAARKLGRKVSTVQSWKTKGFIPAHRQQEVLDAARACGDAITPASFFDNGGVAHQAGDTSMSEKLVQGGGDHESPALETSGAADEAAVIAG